MIIDHMMYIWLLRYGAEQIQFFIILDHFRPCYPPNDPKNQCKRNAKTAGDIILLHMCTINDDHMMYGS